MIFRKLRNPVSRQAQAAASNETANTQPSSDDEQPEPTLVRSSRSSPTAGEIPVTVVTNKAHKRKTQVSERTRSSCQYYYCQKLQKEKAKPRNSRQYKPHRINDKLVR